MVKHTMPPAPEWRVTAVLASSVGHGWHIRAPFMQDWSCYCCLYTWIHLWGSPLRTANALQCLICVSFAISNFSSSSGFVWCKTLSSFYSSSSSLSISLITSSFIDLENSGVCRTVLHADFHPSIVCSCGKCKQDEDIMQGKSVHHQVSAQVWVPSVSIPNWMWTSSKWCRICNSPLTGKRTF